MSDWAHRSQSYRRGYVAGQERDVYFAKLVDGAADQEEAMRGYADGLASVNEADERERFEAWYRQDCEQRRRIFNRAMVRHHRTGEYRNREDETAWQAWQAALTFGVNHGDSQSRLRNDHHHD